MKPPILILILAALAGTARAQTAAEAPPSLEFAFEEFVTLAPSVTPGQTSHGGRNIIPITGGHFEGPLIKGSVMPGGWDWQLRRADGCLDIRADYMLRTDDGVVINVVNTGVFCPPTPADPAPRRTTPVFEAPLGKYAWLSQNSFVGALTPAKTPDGGAAVRIRFFRVR